MVKKGLGKGLSGLIPTYDEKDDFNEIPKKSAVNANAAGAAGGVSELDINQIDANPNQPRKKINDETLADLAASIKSHGVLQPITVVENSGRYMIVAGERRYRACLQLGLSRIPVIIKNYSPKEIKELALIENLQRDDLTPVEIARGFKELMAEYKFTQDMLAERLGMQRPTVANYLRLLTLVPAVLEMLEKGDLTMGHAKVLCGVADKALQERAAKMVVKNGLNVRKLEETLRLWQLPTGKTAPKKEQSPELKDLVKIMGRVFGTKVACFGDDKKGRIFIDYYNRADLDRIYEVLRKIK